MNEKFTPHDAQWQAIADKGRHDKTILASEIFESRADASRQRSSQYGDLALRAAELHASPRWKDRVEREGLTVDSLRRDLEGTAARLTDDATIAQGKARFERAYADTVVEDAAKNYADSPSAYYHAAVAEANMQGVHINTGPEQLHAQNVSTPPVEPQK